MDERRENNTMPLAVGLLFLFALIFCAMKPILNKIVVVNSK